jgi:hypothetical protein
VLRFPYHPYAKKRLPVVARPPIPENIKINGVVVGSLKQHSDDRPQNGQRRKLKTAERQLAQQTFSGASMTG